MKKLIKKLMSWLKKPMTKEEEKNLKEWTMAQCGVPKCPCCRSYHK